MVEIAIGDIFQANAQTLVNPVNCVGVMGKGLALEFKRQFPGMFVDYVVRCRCGEVKIGQPYLYKSTNHKWIINFPTKNHWRSRSKLEDIEEGFGYILTGYKSWGIKSVAFPALGCGEGQLLWKTVRPVLYRCASKMDIPVTLYAPFSASVLL